MKKHNYKAIGAASILCLAAMATSCSQELEEGKVQTENNKAELNVVKLNFATDALTRGTMYDDIAQMPDDATFGVYGYAHKDNDPANDPNFINNGSAKKKDGVVHVDGEVATYKKKMPNVRLAAVYPRLSDGNQFKRTGTNTYTLTYSLQEDMANQKDLMIGQADEFSMTDGNTKNDSVNGGKTINMHHALTAINFAIGDCVPTGYIIEGIGIEGLKTNGTCHVDLSKTTDAERFKWDTKNATKGKVHIKTNPATTTKINGTPFTGVKGDGNKYDNLTVFMIPQKIDKDAVAKVYLIKAKGDLENEPRKSKMIPINLMTVAKTKNNGTTYKGITEYNAGEVKQYRLSLSDTIYKGDLTKKSTDVKLCVKVLYPDVAKKYEKTLEPKDLTNPSSSINFKDKRWKVDEKPHTYKVYIESYRFAGLQKTGSGKLDFPKEAMVAPQTFKIKKIEFSKKKTGTYQKMPEDYLKPKVVQQPKGDNRVGAFTLIFHPEKFPQEKPGGGKVVQQTSKYIYLKIYIVLDGFEGTVFEIMGIKFPTA